MGPKRKREVEKSDQPFGEEEEIEDLGEAIEDIVNIDEEEKDYESEPSGEDLMEDLEKYYIHNI